jgi:hypothetical protein
MACGFFAVHAKRMAACNRVHHSDDNSWKGASGETSDMRNLAPYSLFYSEGNVRQIELQEDLDLGLRTSFVMADAAVLH